MDPNKITIIEDDEQPARDKNTSKFSKRMENAPVVDMKTEGNSASYLKWGGIAGLGIVALVLIIILGGRAITGYSVYSAMTQQGVPLEFVSDMTGLATAKSTAEAQAATALADAEVARQTLDTELAKITQERESHAATKAALEADLTQAVATSNKLQDELDSKKSAFEDSSRRLCCVQRVYDNKITGYAITTQGTVACVTDGSGTNIKC